MLTPLPCPRMFTPAECDAIVALADEGEFREAGLVRGRQNRSIRTARTVWLDEDGSAAWVFRRVMETVMGANRSHFRLDLTEFAERAQLARYDGEDTGHFDWHSDIGAGPFAGKRKLTLVAQLSDPGDYDGGALEIDMSGTPEATGRERGAAILFPSFALHRVTPVTRGRRHSLTTWVHGPDFR